MEKYNNWSNYLKNSDAKIACDKFLETRVIEIKTQKITHQDLGQLQMYVNYFDRYEKLPDETPTIGILLCASKHNEMVKLALPEENCNILASQYQLYLPSENELLAELKRELDMNS